MFCYSACEYTKDISLSVYLYEMRKATKIKKNKFSPKKKPADLIKCTQKCPNSIGSDNILLPVYYYYILDVDEKKKTKRE